MSVKSRNPFGAGTVFQSKIYAIFTPLKSRNPFGAGTVFQLMELIEERQQIVAIPLEQGRFFNEPATGRKHHQASQSLWSRDGFSMGKLIPLPIGQKSQSLWGRDGFSMNDDNPLRMQARSQSLWGRDGFSIDCLAQRHPV